METASYLSGDSERDGFDHCSFVSWTSNNFVEFHDLACVDIYTSLWDGGETFLYILTLESGDVMEVWVFLDNLVVPDDRIALKTKFSDFEYMNYYQKYLLFNFVEKKWQFFLASEQFPYTKILT